MTITVQVSDFRKNMAMYLGKLKTGHKLEIKSGNDYVGKLLPHDKTRRINKGSINNFLVEAEILVSKWSGLKMKAKTNDELVKEIDNILYGTG